MEDHEIVGLYWARAENAVAETAAKYGSQLRRTAGRVLRSPQDCEECVNDSYLALWNGIPPARPEHLGAYAGRVARNLALKKYEYLSAEKRNAEAVRSLEELGDCVSGGPGMDAELEGGARRRPSAISSAASPGRSGRSSCCATGTSSPSGRSAAAAAGARARSHPPSLSSGGSCGSTWKRRASRYESH